MRRIFLLIILIIDLTGINAQDSIRAVNIFKHKIIEGKRTEEKLISEQRTYDLNDRLVLQISYDDSVPNINSVTLFFYTEDKLVSKETFNTKDEPLKIKRYSYNNEDQLIEKRIYLPVKGKMENTQTVRYTYKDERLISKTIANKQGKWLKNYKYAYPENREVISIKYNKKFEKSLNRKEVTNYFDGTLLTKKESLLVYRDKNEKTETIEYTYKKETDKLTKEIWSTNSAITKRIEYSWYRNGTPNRVSIYNSDDILIEHLSHRYLQRILKLSDQPMYDLQNQ